MTNPNVRTRDLFVVPEDYVHPELSSKVVDGFRSEADFIEAGSLIATGGEEYNWRLGDLLVRAVDALGIAVTKGKPKNNYRRIIDCPETVRMGIVGGLGEVNVDQSMRMALISREKFPDYQGTKALMLPEDVPMIARSSQYEIVTAYRFKLYENPVHPDAEVWVLEEWLEKPPTLTSLGEAMGVDKQRASMLHACARFYPPIFRVPDRMTLNTYDVARRYAEDLEDALELLQKADDLKLRGKRFSDYCNGVFFRGVLPEGEPLPPFLLPYLPVAHQTGEGIVVYITVKKE